MLEIPDDAPGTSCRVVLSLPLLLASAFLAGHQPFVDELKK